MKHTDLNKVEVGDLWVSDTGDNGRTCVVLKDLGARLLLHVPEGTTDWSNSHLITVISNYQATVSKKLLQDELNDGCFYFVR